MTRVNPFTRPTPGAAEPSPAPGDPVPDDLVERIIEVIHDEVA